MVSPEYVVFVASIFPHFTMLHAGYAITLLAVKNSLSSFSFSITILALCSDGIDQHT